MAVSEKSLWADEGGIAEVRFQAGDGVEWVRLEMTYRRPEGEVRGEGAIVVEREEMNDK